MSGVDTSQPASSVARPATVSSALRRGWPSAAVGAFLCAGLAAPRWFDQHNGVDRFALPLQRVDAMWGAKFTTSRAPRAASRRAAPVLPTRFSRARSVGDTRLACRGDRSMPSAD